MAEEKPTQYNFQKSRIGFVIDLHQNKSMYTRPTSEASNKEVRNSRRWQPSSLGLEANVPLIQSGWTGAIFLNGKKHCGMLFMRPLEDSVVKELFLCNLILFEASGLLYLQV